MGPSPEEKKKQQEQEDAERLADHLARHPEPIISPANLEEDEPKIAELEAMIASFEATHSLAELHAIVDLSPDLATLFKHADDLADPQRIENDIEAYKKHNPGYVEIYKAKIAAARAIVLAPEDARRFEIRMAAKKDLVPIIAKLSTIRNKELEAKCKRLQRAVGSINNGKVNHETVSL